MRFFDSGSWSSLQVDERRVGTPPGDARMRGAAQFETSTGSKLIPSGPSQSPVGGAASVQLSEIFIEDPPNRHAQNRAV
jgi:hypothetical protein